MNCKHKLDDHLNGLVVAVVIALSVGLSVSVSSSPLGAGVAVASTPFQAVSAPSSQVTAMLMAVQMPR